MKSSCRNIGYLIVAFSLIIFTNFQTASASVSIDWELENSFRMFLKPEFTRLHRNEFESLTDEEKKNPILSVERRLALKHPHGWAEAMYRHTCWNYRKRTYKRCKGRKRDYLHPKAHIIIARLKGEFASGVCRWQAFTPDRGKKLQDIEKACGKSVKLRVPYPSGAFIQVTHKDQVVSKSPVNAREIASETIKVQDLFIVGLGDSYASGEGNPDRPIRFNDKRDSHYGVIVGKGIKLEGFPAREGKWKWIGDRRFARKDAGWQSNACHRSLYSYQLRVALQLALENKKRAVTFAGFACSGAEALVGLLDRYKGSRWVKYPPKDSQINSAALAMCGPNKADWVTHTTTYTMRGAFPSMENLNLYKCNRRNKDYRKIDFLLLSIGGNDVGFARLVANAILRDKTALKSLGGWMGQIYDVQDAEGRLAELAVRYKAINRAFHNVLYIPWKQSDRIILTAYPKIGFREDGTTICGNGNKGMDLHPVFKVKSKKVMDGELFSFKLNTFMRNVSEKFGWSYVDEHREQFGPHGYCAVNGQDQKNQIESFAIPKLQGNKWVPYPPSAYRAYYPRQRWIRTPNDVYMGTNEHVDRKLIGKVLKLKNLNAFQLIYSGTYGGSFHPTAEGQAAIADAVVRKIKMLMKKYKY